MSNDTNKIIDLAIIELTALRGNVGKEVLGQVTQVVNKARNAILWERAFPKSQGAVAVGTQIHQEIEKRADDVTYVDDQRDLIKRWWERAAEEAEKMEAHQEHEPFDDTINKDRDFKFEQTLSEARTFAARDHTPYHITHHEKVVYGNHKLGFAVYYTVYPSGKVVAGFPHNRVVLKEGETVVGVRPLS